MIISVNSFDEAKNYPVLFNTSEILLDNNRDVFYVKAVDSMGKYSINTYKFEQIENEQPLSPENFVTRKQFDDLNSKLDQMMRFMTESKSSVPNGGEQSNEQFNSEQSGQHSVRTNKR